MKYKSSGFTLIEAIATMVILAFAMSGALYMLSSIIFTTEKNEKRLMATYLAQECTELVRNARDTAWKQRLPWDWAFDHTEFIIEADHRNTAPPVKGKTMGLHVSNFLNVDATKLYIIGSRYTHDSTGQPTAYQRKVVTKSKSTSAIALECIVEWDYRGQDESVAINTVLTNWYKN